MGFLKWLFGAKGDAPRDSRGDVVIRTTERIEVKDPATGIVTRFDTPADMPPALRKALDDAVAGRGSQPLPATSHTEVHTEYRVVGPDGQLHVYKSRDEMPPEVRAMLGRK